MSERAWSEEMQRRTLHRVLDSKWVKDWSLAVDGGANIGGWTAVMLERFQTVHAFEPGADSFSRLRARCGTQAGAVLHEQALLDRACAVNIVMPPKRNASTSCYAQPAEAGAVQAITLDSLALPACGLIKLDLEGAEYLALKGARRTIKKYRPVLILEIDRHGKRYGVTAGQTVRLVTDMGYRLAFGAAPDMVFVPC
jgi:FkbM family methyltransferase